MTKINRKKAPKINNITKVNFLSPTKEVLENGIHLYKLQLKNEGLIQIDFLFEAGTGYSQKNLLSMFSASLFKEAPNNMKPDEFSEFLDFYGCLINVIIGSRFAGFKLIMPIEHVKTIMPVINNLIKNPSIPEKEYKVLLKNYYAKLRISLRKNKFLAHNKLNTLLFGKNHPHGLILKLKDINNISLDDIKEFINNHYNSNNCKIFISGEISNDILNNLRIDLGKQKWGNNCFNQNNIFNIEESKTKINKIIREKSMQSSVWIGKFIKYNNEEDLHGIEILNTILGGYFGSRLMKNIREDKGYTYGIGSFLSNYPNNISTLRITTETGVKFTKDTISEVFKEIHKLQTELVSEEELNLVKNYMMGEILSAFNGVFSTAAAHIKLLELDKDYKFINKQVESILSIDNEKIRDLANKHLNEKDFHVVVAGIL
jgi:zinc protease